MTEKEFLEKVSAVRCSAVKALEFAKQHGAKFDPESIELPPLQVSGSCHHTGFCQSVCTASLPGYPHGRALTGLEAKEIIRRCELFPRLRAYILNSGTIPNLALIEMVDMIDGKII